MSTDPEFTSVINSKISQVSVANVALDGTGTLVDIFVAGAGGSRLDQILVNAIATTTAGVIRFFYKDGANTRLIGETLVDAVVPSTILEAWNADVSLSAAGYLLLKTGDKIQASTHNGEIFNITTIGGDY